MKEMITIIDLPEKRKRNNASKKNNRRNSDGLTCRNIKKDNMKKSINDLKENGLSNIEISSRLKVSLRTVFNHLN